MEKNNILNILYEKIKEHKSELEICQNNLLDNTNKLKYKSIEEAAKLLVLKDKLLFHKVSLLVLEDLKVEVEKL